MLADGGDCLADLGAQRDQPDLYGNVASDSTAFRVIDSVDEECLARLRRRLRSLERGRGSSGRARSARAREQRPELTVIDIDATLTTAHSEKEEADGNFKGGYGHHPLLCYLDETGEAPAGILRPGNAGSNTAADHKLVLDLALGQLDHEALAGEILVRADGAGSTHELTVYCREGSMRFSFGFDLSEPRARGDHRDARIGVDQGDPRRPHRARAQPGVRDHRPSRPVHLAGGIAADRQAHEAREGDQQSFADHDGYRLAVFLTDQQGDDIPQLDLTHRGHARVEDHIRQGKDCGLSNLPFQSLRSQPGMAVARSARPRPDRLDQPSYASPSDARAGSSNGCATACFTNQVGSPATPARRSCASHATGPGQASSPPRSHAYGRCRHSSPDPPAATQTRRSCPTASVSLPINSAHITAGSPNPSDAAHKPPSDTPIHPRTRSTEASRPVRSRYCKPTNSGATARSRSTSATPRRRGASRIRASTTAVRASLLHANPQSNRALESGSKRKRAAFVRSTEKSDRAGDSGADR